MSRSLARIFSTGVFVLLLFFTFIQGAVFYLLWNRFSAQAQQRAEWNVAEEEASELSPYLAPYTDYASLRVAIDKILAANLGEDIHLLDEGGGVVASFSRFDSVPFKGKVPLAPIKKFLDDPGRTAAPIFGLNPFSAKENALFSVSPITIGEKKGYLYVVLNNGYSNATQTRYVTQATIVSIVFSSLAALFGAGLLGGLLLKPFARRIAAVMGTVRRIGGGDRAARAPAEGNDELSELGKALNGMAAEIESSVFKLERKDLLRRELVENIWHDIRGPVAALRGLAETLEREQAGTDPASKEQLALGISSNAARLSRFLDELRDVSDLDMDEKVPAKEAVDLVDIADELCAGLAQHANEARVTLKVEADPVVSPVLGDSALLSRLLQNLIENALRFAGDGGTVRVEIRDHEDAVHFSVNDSGSGISPSDLPHLFDRNFRGDQQPHFGNQRIGSSDAKFPDSRGLGLAIVKKIAEAHGSDVLVDSSKDQGTTFSVRLKKFPSGTKEPSPR